MLIEKHGDLIDRDALIDEMCKIAPREKPMCSSDLVEAIGKLINAAPVLVPRNVPVALPDHE